ncbi:hypothetical protein [Candidatus Weimeria sp. HCP3S3_B5]|uniref:hypothetical protein n=1 Tax=Candidatus Weimeria sp. HCP3S3_B5 TaxID=3438871 RepID=UPI003F8B3405
MIRIAICDDSKYSIDDVKITSTHIQCHAALNIQWIHSDQAICFCHQVRAMI